MTAIVQLVSVCAEKFHLANLVDAYAELIRSRAYWNEVNAFDFYAFIGLLALVALVALSAVYVTTKD